MALVYNLLSGWSYFLEDDSAEIIREILRVRRGGIIDAKEIATNTDTELECLTEFLGELATQGLVSYEPMSDALVASKREMWRSYGKATNNDVKDSSSDNRMPYDVSTAETEYFDRVGGITSVMFELTYNCSEKCIHCYNLGASRSDDERADRSPKSPLTLQEYYSVIDQLVEQGLVKVCLSGGDPFSNPLAWDIIAYLYEKEIAFDIFTNGLGLVDKVALLAEMYPRLVGISIYSDNAEVHDKITRVKGSWAKSMSVATELSKLGVPLNLKCCVMKPNLKSYRGVARIAEQLGATPQFEVSVTDSIDGDKCVSRFLRLSESEYEIILRDRMIPLYVGSPYENFGRRKRLSSEIACRAGKDNLCITPDGDVIPCCSFHMSFGSVKTGTIHEALNSPLLTKWRNSTLNEYNGCGTLPHCDYCNLCPGNNNSEHGRWTEPAENNCYIAKIRYNLALRLQDGNDPLQGYEIDEVLAVVPDYEFPPIHRIIK